MPSTAGAAVGAAAALASQQRAQQIHQSDGPAPYRPMTTGEVSFIVAAIVVMCALPVMCGCLLARAWDQSKK